MSDDVYTLAAWRVLPGREDEFVAAWRALGEEFRSLPYPPGGSGTLLRSIDDPSLFYSFGSWSSIESVRAMRTAPEVVAMLEHLRSLCSEAHPGAYTVAARA